MAILVSSAYIFASFVKGKWQIIYENEALKEPKARALRNSTFYFFHI